MRKWSTIASLIGLGLVIPGAAFAQTGWSFRCIDPENDTPFSDDYGLQNLENDLIGVTLGVSGTVTHGGQNGPCFGPTARTLDAAGRIGFYSGREGSVQTDFDNFLAYTYGAPSEPVGDYGFVRILKGDNTTANSVLFGDGGLGTVFRGASNRYVIANWSDADVAVVLRLSVIGDAVRMRWRMTNLTEEALDLGLLFAQYTGMMTSGGQTDSQTGANTALTARAGIGGIPKFTADGYLGMVNMPTTRPVRTEYHLRNTSSRFPSYVDFAFGQTEYYGMRIENVPSANFQDATSADQITIGDWFFMLQGNNARQSVFGDNTGLPETADVAADEFGFLQRFPVATVSPGGFRDVVHYVRNTWSVGDYRDPYMTVVDAPKTVGTNPSGVNGLDNNPFTIRVYVDNQFAEIDKEVNLSNTRIRIVLGNGMELADGEVDSKIIPTILPNGIASVDFQVRGTGLVFGDIPYQVFVTPDPGPARTLSGSIQFAAVPRLSKPAGPTMVGMPYTFNDASLNAILGLQAGVDYQAYRWEPRSEEYVPVATPVRGVGYWLVFANPFVGQLLGAQFAEDAGTGGLRTPLYRGWNLISNPYNYPVKLADLNLVISSTENSGVLSWTEAVSNGAVNGGLAFYNTDGGFYDFISNPDTFISPLQAYWLYTPSFDSIQVSWPPVFTPGLPNSGRSSEPRFEQSDREWRLQLTGRSKVGADVNNFVGAAADSKAADSKDLLKPPAAPGAPFQISIVDTHRGEETRMAQAIKPRSGKMSWQVEVKADKAGEVTMAWPNLASLPKNLRFRLSDPATGLVRDLRSSSSYTVNMTEPGTRVLTLTAEQGGTSRALIGNVTVGRDGRDVSGPVTIAYNLSASATVSVRILSSTGKEVYTVTRGRSDAAGENNATWTLRDNANRAVAPGVYRAEIVAESESGERVRRIVPINVIR